MFKITEENFRLVDPKLLLEQRRYIEIEDMVVGIDAAADPYLARDVAIELYDKLDVIGDRVDRNLLNQYSRLLKALRLYSLRTVNDEEKEKFFREQILDLFTLDFVDVQYWIDLMFRAYYRAPDLTEQIKSAIIKGLENNVQRVGKNQILLAGKIDQKFASTVQNWIKDYNVSTKINFEKKTRSSLEQVTYFNQSANVKTLKPEEKKVLMSVLKLYDWIRFNNFKYDFSLPGQPKEEDVILPGEKHELLDPEIVNLINKKYRNDLTVPKPAAISKKSDNQNEDDYLKLAGISKTGPKSFEEKVESLSKKPFDVKKGVELEAFLSKIQAGQGVPKPPVSVAQKSSVKMTPEEIKREVNTEELPAPPVGGPAHIPELSKQHVGTAGLGIKNMPPIQAEPKKPIPVQTDLKKILSDLEPEPSVSGIVNLPTMRPMPKMAPPLSKLPTAPKAAPQPVKILPLASVSNISAINDFKKIDVRLLRQGSPASNIELIKEKITSVAREQRSFPALAVQAFEQSPLFKLYLNLGAEMLLDHSDNRVIAYANASKKLSAGGTPVLTLQEFEMVADLKKEIERL